MDICPFFGLDESHSRWWVTYASVWKPSLSVFLQFLRFTLPNKASLLCFTDNGMHTWLQPKPEFIRLRESLIQRLSVSRACVWCRVSILRDSARVLFIHSRLNMSVSGRHDNGWWWSYTWTYPLCGKIFHVQDFFYSSANSDCRYLYILNFHLVKNTRRRRFVKWLCFIHLTYFSTIETESC